MGSCLLEGGLTTEGTESTEKRCWEKTSAQIAGGTLTRILAEPGRVGGVDGGGGSMYLDSVVLRDRNALRVTSGTATLENRILCLQN